MKENKNGEKDEEAGKPKAGFTPTNQDDDKSKELEKAVTSIDLKKTMSEKENEL